MHTCMAMHTRMNAYMDAYVFAEYKRTSAEEETARSPETAALFRPLLPPLSPARPPFQTPSSFAPLSKPPLLSPLFQTPSSFATLSKPPLGSSPPTPALLSRSPSGSGLQDRSTGPARPGELPGPQPETSVKTLHSAQVSSVKQQQCLVWYCWCGSRVVLASLLCGVLHHSARRCRLLLRPRRPGPFRPGQYQARPEPARLVRLGLQGLSISPARPRVPGPPARPGSESAPLAAGAAGC